VTDVKGARIRLFQSCVLSGVVALAASCSSAAPPSATPTQRTEATATPTPSPTTAPTVSIPELADGGTMFPGTYHTRFVPAMTIKITNLVNLDCAAGYRCRGDIDVNLPPWLGLEFGNDHGVELDVTRIDKVFASATSDALIDPPADLASWIAAQPGVVRLAKAVPVTVGGVEGVRLDFGSDRIVRFGSTDQADLPCCGIGPKERIWLTVVNVDGHWVLIKEDLGPDNTVHEFDNAIRGLQPIVDSITWG